MWHFRAFFHDGVEWVGISMSFLDCRGQYIIDTNGCGCGCKAVSGSNSKVSSRHRIDSQAMILHLNYCVPLKREAMESMHINDCYLDGCLVLKMMRRQV